MTSSCQTCLIHHKPTHIIKKCPTLVSSNCWYSTSASFYVTFSEWAVLINYVFQLPQKFKFVHLYHVLQKYILIQSTQHSPCSLLHIYYDMLHLLDVISTGSSYQKSWTHKQTMIQLIFNQKYTALYAITKFHISLIRFNPLRTYILLVCWETSYTENNINE
jgi:hypothetical protein